MLVRLIVRGGWCLGAGAVALAGLATAAAAQSQFVVRPPSALQGEARRLDSLGLVAWNLYESRAHAARFGGPVQDSKAFESPRHMAGIIDADVVALTDDRFDLLPRSKQAKAIERLASHYKPPLGEAAYRTALGHFRDAQRVDSASPAIRRHIYRALAAQNDWALLAEEAQRATRSAPADVDAWLAHGLALHRLEQYSAAAATFDSALTRMSPAERGSFTSITRLLTPKGYANVLPLPDSLRYRALSDAEQQGIARVYWLRADPRPATPVNEAMLEYFARRTFAEIRWGGEGQRGVDTHRGDIHLRFGPPDHIYAFGGMHVWTYRDNSIFFFGAGPGALGARIGQNERRVVEDSILIEQPASWASMPIARRTWPMLMRAARFRGTGDSADVVVTAAVPVRSLLGDAELGGRLPIDVDLDVHQPDATVGGAEHRRVTVSRDSLPAAINGTWRRRLGAGRNVVRIQAEQPDVGRGAVSSADVTVDSLTGFGISDILLGTEPAATSDATPARWHDVNVAPVVGVFPFAQPIGLVWETYDLAARDGKVDYTVTVDIERTFKRSLAGFTARIARNLVNVITQNGSATGKVSVTYPQSRAATPIATDFLSINLDGSVPGPYRLVITIRDLTSGRVVSRRADFTLTPD